MRLQREAASGARSEERSAGDCGGTTMGFEPWLLTIAVLLIGVAATA